MSNKKFDKRNYIANLTNNTSKLDEVMNNLLSDSKSGKLLKELTLRNIWKKSAGDLIYSETIKVFQKDGKLFVKLHSPAAKTEFMLNKERILQKFNTEYSGKGGIIKTIVLI